MLDIQKYKAFFSNRQVAADFNTWHSRLRHCCTLVMKLLQAQGQIRVNNKSTSTNICVTCQLGKSKYLPFELYVNRCDEPFDLIHCDLCGPTPVQSWTHHRYYLSFIDDTRFI